jgi:hypothetical protein
MAKADRKLSLPPACNIALNKLVPSEHNVPRTSTNDSIEQLAQDIAYRGLLLSLNVRMVRVGCHPRCGLPQRNRPAINHYPISSRTSGHIADPLDRSQVAKHTRGGSDRPFVRLASANSAKRNVFLIASSQ